jgi:hypothetical protein
LIAGHFAHCSLGEAPRSIEETRMRLQSSAARQGIPRHLDGEAGRFEYALCLAVNQSLPGIHHASSEEIHVVP